MKYPWITPFISSNEDGYITAEWYEEERELHILIRENEAEYLQVWGINIYTEMHEDFFSREDYLRLWDWLLHGQKQQSINIYTEMHFSREDYLRLWDWLLHEQKQQSINIYTEMHEDFFQS